MEKFLNRFGLIIIGTVIVSYFILVAISTYRTDSLRREVIKMDQKFQIKKAEYDSTLFEIQKKAWQEVGK